MYILVALIIIQLNQVFKTSFRRYFPFIKDVFLFSITAFGGPQGHFGMMLKTFVHQRKYLTQNELIEYNSFCNFLPGASSTQVLTLIGYKKGGIVLATITMVIWILPACTLMTAFSFLLDCFDQKALKTDIFRFMEPMAIGYLVFAAIKTYRISINNPITKVIMGLTIIITYLLFKVPWVIPITILLGGCITNLSSKRIPQTETRPQKIKWANIWLFVAVFIVAGVLSETARKQNWQNRGLINLFENNYRFGSLVFGGGQVLIPLMYEQFVIRPLSERVIIKNPNVLKIQKEDFYAGAGIVRAIPGPVFSIAAYMGGMAMKEHGKIMQLTGSIIGTAAIFLPSALLVLFFYPIWHNLQKYAAVYRALEGINAVVVGIMFAAIVYMMKDVVNIADKSGLIQNVCIIAGTWILINYVKIASPIIVLICMLLGWIF